MDDDREASLYVDDGGALQGDPLFVGPFTDAVKMVWAMETVPRSYARIVTANWVYEAGQLECMRREDEGEL
jgi:hypothetical protein